MCSVWLVELQTATGRYVVRRHRMIHKSKMIAVSSSLYVCRSGNCTRGHTVEAPAPINKCFGKQQRRLAERRASRPFSISGESQRSGRYFKISTLDLSATLAHSRDFPLPRGSKQITQSLETRTTSPKNSPKTCVTKPDLFGTLKSAKELSPPGLYWAVGVLQTWAPEL